jgi:hypothetical protein
LAHSGSWTGTLERAFQEVILQFFQYLSNCLVRDCVTRWKYVFRSEYSSVQYFCMRTKGLNKFWLPVCGRKLSFNFSACFYENTYVSWKSILKPSSWWLSRFSGSRPRL